VLDYRVVDATYPGDGTVKTIAYCVANIREMLLSTPEMFPDALKRIMEPVGKLVSTVINIGMEIIQPSREPVPEILKFIGCCMFGIFYMPNYYPSLVSEGPPQFLSSIGCRLLKRDDFITDAIHNIVVITTGCQGPHDQHQQQRCSSLHIRLHV
jgi:hypothetical protein